MDDLWEQFMEEDLESFGVLIFNYFSDAQKEQELERISNRYVPHCKKIVLLDQKNALPILHLSNAITLDKFIFFPLILFTKYLKIVKGIYGFQL